MDQGLGIFRDRVFWFSLVSGGFFLTLTLWFGFSGDQALSAYAAWVWKNFHLPPYLGAFDHNFPGIFIINRLALELCGGSILGFRIFDVLFQLLTLAAVYYVALKFSGRKSAGFLACVFYGIHYYSLGVLDVFRPDVYVFCLLIFGAAIVMAMRDRPRLRAALAGAIAGFIFLIKPTYGLSWAVFALWFGLEGIKTPPRRIWSEEIIFVAFCLLSPLAVILYYQGQGALRELYLATIYWNSRVYTQFEPLSLASAARIIRGLITDHPLILFLAGFGMIAAAKESGPERKQLFWVLTAFMAIGLFSAVIQNKNYYYHRDPFWGFAAIFAGAGLALIGDRARFESKIWSRAGRALLYSLAVILAFAGIEAFWVDFAFRHAFRDLRSSQLASAEIYPSNSLTDQYRAAEYLKPLLRESDQVAYFGMWASIVHWQLKKKSPSRFIYAQHLLMRNWRGELLPLQARHIEEYIDAITSARPRFILVYELLLKSDHRDFINQRFGGLRTFIERDYQLRQKIGNVDIYELK